MSKQANVTGHAYPASGAAVVPNTTRAASTDIWLVVGVDVVRMLQDQGQLDSLRDTHRRLQMIDDLGIASRAYNLFEWYVESQLELEDQLWFSHILSLVVNSYNSGCRRSPGPAVASLHCLPVTSSNHQQPYSPAIRFGDFVLWGVDYLLSPAMLPGLYEYTSASIKSYLAEVGRHLIFQIKSLDSRLQANAQWTMERGYAWYVLGVTPHTYTRVAHSPGLVSLNDVLGS